MNRRKVRDPTNPITLRVPSRELIVEVAAEVLNSIKVKTEGLREKIDIKLMTGRDDAMVGTVENLEMWSEIGEMMIRAETDMRNAIDGMTDIVGIVEKDDEAEAKTGDDQDHPEDLGLLKILGPVIGDPGGLLPERKRPISG